MLFGHNLSVNAALKKVLFPIENQGDDRFEAGFAVGDTAHLFQHFQHIVLIRASLASIACGINPRTTVQRFDFKPRVVGETVDVIMVKHVLCFLQCISLQGIGSFRDLGTADFAQVFDMIIGTENGAYFLGFVQVVSGENNIHNDKTQKDDIISYVIHSFSTNINEDVYSAALPISMACLPL